MSDIDEVDPFATYVVPRFHELKDGEEDQMHQKTSVWPLKVHGVVENGGSPWLVYF